jgi:hypothetical protein
MREKEQRVKGRVAAWVIAWSWVILGGDWGVGLQWGPCGPNCFDLDFFLFH